MVPERPRRSQRAEAGGSGASVVRVPTPPAPPSGSAATANLPTPPPGPTRAEHDDQLDTHQESSVSPTVEPPDEGATLVPKASAMHPDVSGGPGISGADAEPEDISTTFPCDEDPELIESMEDETYPFGPASGN
eukprot:1355236-Pyramimonas_sp.AAC.1